MVVITRRTFIAFLTPLFEVLNKTFFSRTLSVHGVLLWFRVKELCFAFRFLCSLFLTVLYYKSFLKCSFECQGNILPICGHVPFFFSMYVQL